MFKINGFLSENSENGISIAILMNPDRSMVKLVAMRNDEKIEGTTEVELTSARFDELIADYPDISKRLYHVFEMCKVDKDFLSPSVIVRTIARTDSKSKKYLLSKEDRLHFEFMLIIALFMALFYLLGKWLHIF